MELLGILLFLILLVLGSAFFISAKIYKSLSTSGNQYAMIISIGIFLASAAVIAAIIWYAVISNIAITR